MSVNTAHHIHRESPIVIIEGPDGKFKTTHTPAMSREQATRLRYYFSELGITMFERDAHERAAREARAAADADPFRWVATEILPGAVTRTGLENWIRF